jgi:hypothetical protein
MAKRIKIYMPRASAEIRPLLWSSGQSSWLQIQRSRVRFPALPEFWEVVGLERGPLSLVSTIEELLGRNSSGSGLENREYGRGDSLRWPLYALYPQKLALTSPTCGGRTVGIVRLQTKTTEFLYLLCRVFYTANYAELVKKLPTFYRTLRWSYFNILLYLFNHLIGGTVLEVQLLVRGLVWCAM